MGSGVEGGGRCLQLITGQQGLARHYKVCREQFTNCWKLTSIYRELSSTRRQSQRVYGGLSKSFGALSRTCWDLSKSFPGLSKTFMEHNKTCMELSTSFGQLPGTLGELSTICRSPLKSCFGLFKELVWLNKMSCCAQKDEQCPYIKSLEISKALYL